MLRSMPTCFRPFTKVTTRGHQHRGEDVDGNVSARVNGGIVPVEDQPLHAQHQEKRDRSGEDGGDHPACCDGRHVPPVDGLEADRNHGKPDDGPDDRMRGRYGPAEPGRDRQPDSGSQQSRQHADDQQIRIVLESLGVDDALADRRRDLAAGQKRPEEFEHTGDQNGDADRDGPRADRRPHRIRNVVGADRPGHVEAGDDRRDEDDGEACVHEIPSPRRENHWSGGCLRVSSGRFVTVGVAQDRSCRSTWCRNFNSVGLGTLTPLVSMGNQPVAATDANPAVADAEVHFARQRLSASLVFGAIRSSAPCLSIESGRSGARAIRIPSHPARVGTDKTDG